MKAAVGYGDHPDTKTAGVDAVREALVSAGRMDQCDLVLLFATALHDMRVLRAAVAAVVGSKVRIIGGGSIGAITNSSYGYAGYQVGVACFWLDGVRVELFDEAGTRDSEYETGRSLGQSLAAAGIGRDASVLLFYDAIYHSNAGFRLLMATPLLAGIDNGLGFLPDRLAGAGLQGDYACSPCGLLTENGLTDGHAMVLHFSGDVRIDNVIMHGCRPATGYYTVTKAEGPVILEINGVRAIDFLDRLLAPGVTHENFPFFLLLGINKGERWSEFRESDYASRLCLGLDTRRGGIVMFEPDMVTGTEFQIMYRSFNLEYMRPRIERIFAGLGNRKPVFAFYINCGGRAAGYGGVDIEDAVMMQNIVADRVPVLGLYTGVEIAALGGAPRGLDWTGVFCLFSMPGDERSGEGGKP